jgi:hypothetical protein
VKSIVWEMEIRDNHLMRRAMGVVAGAARIIANVYQVNVLSTATPTTVLSKVTQEVIMATFEKRISVQLCW